MIDRDRDGVDMSYGNVTIYGEVASEQTMQVLGRFPQNVPLQISSVTLPEHVLDDINSKLQLAQDVKMVQVTNAHPNVALSV